MLVLEIGGCILGVVAMSLLSEASLALGLGVLITGGMFVAMTVIVVNALRGRDP